MKIVVFRKFRINQEQSALGGFQNTHRHATRAIDWRVRLFLRQNQKIIVAPFELGLFIFNPDILNHRPDPL